MAFHRLCHGLFYAEVHHASSRVLQANGCDISFPPQQVCCGALHMHAGERQQARGLSPPQHQCLRAVPGGCHVNNAAGCGAQLKTYGELLADDPEFSARAQHFSAKVRDIAEVLGQEPLNGPLGPRRNGWCTMIPATSSMPSASSTSHGSCCSKFPMCNSSLSAMPILLWSGGDLQPDPAWLSQRILAQNRAHKSRPARRDRHR